MRSDQPGQFANRDLLRQPLPIAIVDDKETSTTAWLRDLQRVFPGRQFAAFNTLSAARRALVSVSYPFGLILDHNLDGDKTVDAQEYGASLAPQVRSNNPWGLALPIAYYSAWCSPEDFCTKIAGDYASLGPTLFFDKNRTPDIVDVVHALDHQFRLTAPVFISAMILIQTRGYDFATLAGAFDEDAGGLP